MFWRTHRVFGARARSRAWPRSSSKTNSPRALNIRLDPLSPRVHLATIWLAALGTWLSGYFILVANSSMHPVGYKIVNGEAQLTSVSALLSNAFRAYLHTMLAGLCASGRS